MKLMKFKINIKFKINDDDKEFKKPTECLVKIPVEGLVIIR